MPIDTTPQHTDIVLGRVYRRAEFADRPEPWGSPLPSIEIICDGDIIIYGSNLPRQSGSNQYVPPIEDTKEDIELKMTKITKCAIKAGFHDACMCSVWIAFCWVEGSSAEPPILRDACMLDWELDHRRRNLGC